MKRLSVRLGSALLIFCLLFTLIPGAAFAEVGDLDDFEVECSYDLYGVQGQYYQWYWTAPDGEDIFDFNTQSEYYPDGLAIHKSSNDSFVVEGTPNEAGTFWVTATCSTADHDFTVILTISIEGGYDKPEMYDSITVHGKAGTAVSDWRWGTLDGENIGDFYVSEGAVPDGLYIPTPGSNAISIEGTPSYACSGCFSVTVETADDIYYVEVYYTIDPAEEVFEVTKSPTSEYTCDGGRATFIAAANNYSYVEWLLIYNGNTMATYGCNTNANYNGCSVITYNYDGREYLVLENIPELMNGYRIQARFTNTNKGVSILTQTCGLSVDPPPLIVPSIISAPAAANATVGNDVKLSVLASDPNNGTLMYQWYSNPAFSLNGSTSIVGATEASYIPPQTVGTVYYYCSVVSVKDGYSSECIVTTPVAVTYTSVKAEDAAVKAGETTDDYSYSDITQVTDYLFRVTFNNYSWDAVNTYYNNLYLNGDGSAAGSTTTGGCSGVQNGAIRGRNVDWSMDEEAEFVVYVPATKDRHASVGVVSGSQIDREAVLSGEENELYQYLPFMIVDGMNDAGVCTQVNVVPVEDCEVRTTGTNPDQEPMMVNLLQRYILDNAASVDEAVELIKGLNLYAPAGEDLNQEYHFMISDPKKCVVVEFVNNEVVILEDQKIITNYYLSSDELTPHSQGVERYSILEENYDLSATAEGMLQLMKKVWFTQAYTITGDNAWYSDFTGGNLTITSPKAGFTSVMKNLSTLYAKGERDENLCITTHTCIYDQQNLTLDIVSQQGDTVFHYDLNSLSK